MMQGDDDGNGEGKCDNALGGKGECETIGGFPGSDEELLLIVRFQGLSWGRFEIGTSELSELGGQEESRGIRRVRERTGGLPGQ